VYQDLGDQHGKAIALSQLAVVRYLIGNYASAEDLLQRALAMLREIGAPDDEAETLNHLGTLHRHRITARPDQAQALHHQALTAARTIHLRLEEAHALEGIGRAALDLGHTTSSIDHLRQALEIYHQLGVPEATQLTADLATLDPAGHRGTVSLNGVSGTVI
jgi:tetratricopeptide (TPR) repeat protein